METHKTHSSYKALLLVFCKTSILCAGRPMCLPCAKENPVHCCQACAVGSKWQKLVLIAFLLRSFQPCSWFLSLLFMMLCFVFVLLVVPHGKISPFHRQGKKSLLPQFLTVSIMNKVPPGIEKKYRGLFTVYDACA